MEQQIGVVFDVHREIESAAKEETALKRLLRPVEPQRRELIDRPDESGAPTGPGRGDFVYDMPLKEELEAMVKADTNEYYCTTSVQLNIANLSSGG